MNYEPKTKNRVIAVVGPIASGKGVLIHILQNQGYSVVSLSDVVREKAKEWGWEVTRENLQNIGDKLRKQFGKVVLAEMVASTLRKNPDTKFVIDGIRNPAEVNFLQKEFGAYIIGITATPKKRFSLMQKRGKEYDPKTWDEFVVAEERDRGIGQDEYGQQVEKCLAKADLILDNNGTQEDFEKNVSYFLKKNL